jgi:hypothetical protein
MERVVRPWVLLVRRDTVIGMTQANGFSKSGETRSEREVDGKTPHRVFFQERLLSPQGDGQTRSRSAVL